MTSILSHLYPPGTKVVFAASWQLLPTASLLLEFTQDQLQPLWFQGSAVDTERLKEALKSTINVNIMLHLYVLHSSTTLMIISTFHVNPQVLNPYSTMEEIAHFSQNLPDYNTRQPVYCECALIMHLLKLDMPIQLHGLFKLSC